VNSQPAPTDRALIPGSERPPLPGASVPAAQDLSRSAEVTVLVRPRASTAPLVEKIASTPPAERSYIERAAFAATYGADPADLAAVQAFAAAVGLHVVTCSGSQ